MRRINFTKMVASGNDFVIIDRIPNTAYRLPNLAKKICDRKFGIGADGLLLFEKSEIADIKMRIFNPDGTEPDICGNGARCAALYRAREQRTENREQIEIETKAGIIESQIHRDNIKIKLTDPKDIKLDIPIKVNGRSLKVNFISIGVPHTVIFVEGLNKIDIVGLSRWIRYHRRFMPHGTNVNFVEVINKDSLRIRTYERGVEDETLSCGTGVAATAIISNIKNQKSKIEGTYKINVHTKSREILKVYFTYKNNKFTNVWLEGKARIVCKGEYYV